MRLLSIVLLLALARCDSSGPDAEAPEPEARWIQEELVPLSVGSYWVYDSLLPDYDSTVVEKDTVVSGVTWFKLMNYTEIDDRHYVNHRFYTYTDSSLVIASTPIMDRSDATKVFKFKEEDDLFPESYEIAEYPNVVWTAWRATGNEAVETPSGSYTAFRYNIEQRRRVTNEVTYGENYYFAPEIGLVKYENSLSGLRRLLRYHISNP